MKITTRLMVEEARRRGWKAEPLDEDFSSVFRLISPRGEVRYMFSCLSNMSSASGFAIAEDKLATYRIAESLNVPVAPYMMYHPDRYEEAKAFLRELQETGDSVVVKPTDQNHGDGITLGITTAEKLHEAVAFAQQFSKRILLQKQGTGKDCRLVVVDGKVVAAATRVPAFVVGDGMQTVEELIDQKNQDSRRGEAHSSALTRIKTTDVARYIGAEKLKDIPGKDEHIQLLGTANLSKGGESIDITDIIHPSYKDAAVKLAVATELGVCGVDFLCQDFAAPLAANNAVLLEINCGPGFRMHHFPSEGTPRNVAGAVLDAFAKHNNWQ